MVETQWESIRQGPYEPNFFSILVLLNGVEDGTHQIDAATNLAIRDPSAPVAPIKLPAPLAKLISRLVEADLFPEPWTDDHASHSQILALAGQVDGWKPSDGQEVPEIGQAGAEFVKNDGAYILTIYALSEDGQRASHHVRSCMNCTVILNVLGVIDVNDPARLNDPQCERIKSILGKGVEERALLTLEHHRKQQIAD